MSSSTEAIAAGSKAILYAKGAVQDPTIIGDCPFTQKARLGLAAEGINQYTIKLEDMSNKSADLLKLNPKGTVPVWTCPTVEDGTIITIPDSEDILQQLCTSVIKRTTTKEKDIIDNELKAFQTSWFPAMKGTSPDGIEAGISALVTALKSLDEALSKLPNKERGPITELEAKLSPLLYHYTVAGVHYRKLDPLPKATWEFLKSVETTPEWKATVYTPETVLAGWKKFF